MTHLCNITRSPLLVGFLVLRCDVFLVLATSPRAIDEVPSQARNAEDAEPSLPPRALIRIGTDDLRTREFLMDIAFSPDGKLIAASSAANANFPRISLFSTRTGREIKRLTPPDRRGGGFHCVAFSPDDAKLLSGDLGGNVTLWDLASARILFRENLHGNGNAVHARVNAVTFSPDGNILASGGTDGFVHLRRVSKPTEVVLDLKTSWNPSGQPVGAIGGGLSRPGAEPGLESADRLAFTPDGIRLVVGSGSSATISIWRVSDGRLVRLIPKAHGNREGAESPSVNSLVVTPDGRQVMSAGSCTVPTEKTGLKDLPKNVVGVSLCEVRLWDLATGDLVKDLSAEDHQGLGLATLSRDGRRLAVAEINGLRMLDTRTGKSEWSILLPKAGGTRPAFSPDGDLVATAVHNAVALFEARTGRGIHHEEATPVGEPLSAAWSPSGDRIVTGHRDGRVRVWEAKTGKLLWSTVPASDPTLYGEFIVPNFVTFSADGRRVVAACGDDFHHGKVAIYEATRGLVVRRVDQDSIGSAALSPDRRMLVVGASSESPIASQLRAIEIETGRMLWAAPPEGKGSALVELRTLQFLPDSHALEAALGTGDVIRFDALTGKELRRFAADWRPPGERPVRPGVITELLWLGAFSLEGRTLVSSHAEFIYVWDVKTGKLRRTIRRTHKWGSCLALAPDGKTLATSDHRSADDYGSDTIRLYNLETGDQMLTLEPPDNRAVVLAFSPDGTKLFTGFHRGSGLVWDVRLGAEGTARTNL
jgi:WD40 repeat protein